MTRLTIEKLTDLVRREVEAAEGGAPRRIPRDGADLDEAELEDLFLALDRYRDPRNHTPVASRRRRSALAVRGAKKLFRTLFRPFLHDTLETQARFNDVVRAAFARVSRTATEMEDDLSGLRRANAELAARLERQETGLRGFRRELDRFRESETGYSDLLAALGRLMESTRTEVRETAVQLVQAGEEEAGYADFHASTSSVDLSRKLYRQYVPRFRECRRVVDLGCGRGPFLALLKESGIPGYGVDRSETMVCECRAAGLEVVEDDALTHLESLAPRSVDGLFAGHLVEHFELSRLMRLFRAAWRALDDRGIFVFESPNTESLAVLASTYFRDPTHRMPRHPETYRHVAEVCGFRACEMLHSLPTDPRHLIQGAPADAALSEGLRENLDGNARRLNELLYAPANFAIACRKGEPGS